MALFKTMYLVWLFTVCNLIELSQSDKQIEDFIEWAKSMDRGRYSGPFQLEKVSYDTLDEYEEHFYKELFCNYAVSATVHMYLMKKILKHSNYKKLVEDWLFGKILFTNQAEHILHAVYNNNHNDSWHTTVDIMWIFLMHTAQVKSLFWNDLEDETVLKTSKIVEKMLEEYIKSKSCLVYDPITKMEVTGVKKAIEDPMYKATNLESLVERVVENKNQLDRQKEHNYKSDNRFNYGQHLLYTDFVRNLLLNCWMRHGQCYVLKLNHFGIQMDLKPIEVQLRHHYRLGRHNNNSLHVRIKEIITFQDKFVKLMKVVAIRIIIRYLLNIKRMSDTTLQIFVDNHVDYCNQKMTEHLNNFAQYFNLTEDQYIRPAIDLLKNSPPTFSDRSVLDGCVQHLLNMLKEMSSDDMRFDTPMNVDENNSEQTLRNVRSIIRQHNLPLPNETSRISFVNESLISVQVLVNYATRVLTSDVDFKLMKSFAQLETSKSYKRLIELENLEDSMVL